MGILANTVSISHFQVLGERPTSDFFQWTAERLARNGFKSIDQTADELATGWVHLDDPQESSFAVPAAFWHDHYLVFTLRRDQRRVPSALLKAYLKQAQDEYLAANPGLSRVPKQKKEDLREAVRGALFARTLPSPATYDVVWDTRCGIVTLTSLSPKVIELFENIFKKTFDGLRLVALYPFARAEMLLDDLDKPLLHRANQAKSDAVLDLIRSNQWLGWDFMLWFVYQTMNATSEYRVNCPGPALQGEPFVAYMDSRLVLQGSGENGTQKITVAGPQDHFNEVRTALHHRKNIIEATLHLEKDENLWKMTLKGEMFHFGAFKSPAVKVEKDNLTDDTSEREAVFYERMAVIEQGLQLFNSLYAMYLRERIGEGWSEKENMIRDWLTAE
jgi:hypothetical protein